MATEKRKIHRVIDTAGTLVQVLPETSAEQVTLADAAGNFTSNNVEGALAEVAQDIKDLETGFESAGKVDDVVNADGTSIVENKVAQMKNAVVKEAGKVTKGLTLTGYDYDSSKSVELSFDGSVEKTIQFNLGAFVVTKGFVANELNVELRETGVTQDTYNSVLVDKYGRVRRGTKEDYALKSYVDTQDGNKLDKAGGSITGDLTIGGNLNVNGSTTTIDSTTLRVEDKLIEVAKSNTTKLTTPAGIVVPKYDGENYGALVIDGDGNAKVGDVKLDSSGNIDVNTSGLQTIATRTGLTDGNLVKWDDTNKTLVPDTAVKSTADSALSKANTNATEIANIKNGTTVVPNANHANTADSAANVTTNINGKAITSIFETNGTTVKNATNASSADTANRTKAGLSFYVDGNTSSTPDYFFNGNKEAKVYSSSDIAFVPYQYTNTFQLRISDDFKVGTSRIEDGAVTDAKLATVSGLTAGQYSAVNVDTKGRVTAGGKSIEWGTSGQTTPSGDLMIGGLFMQLQ